MGLYIRVRMLWLLVVVIVVYRIVYIYLIYVRVLLRYLEEIDSRERGD